MWLLASFLFAACKDKSGSDRRQGNGEADPGGGHYQYFKYPIYSKDSGKMMMMPADNSKNKITDGTTYVYNVPADKNRFG